MALAMAVTSSSHASNYDVFLSFRGTDTRHDFTGNLYKALDDKGIHTFIDDEELQKGEEITPALAKAIHESRIAIVVLSQNYASSSFCLDELSTIINCKSKGLLVVPVFYMVDPSDVRHQRGSYEEALTKHKRRFPEKKLQKWKEALRQVADLSGYHFKQGDAYEYKFIGSIVDWVSEKINHPARLRVGDYLVGLESRVAKVMKLLDVGSDNVVHMVGIHGMGGIGKSTLARAVYNNLIAQNFNGFCYLESVRETSNRNGLEHLQNLLLQEILRDKNINVTSVEQGASMIAKRLQRKKVLLLLDDVDSLKQLEAIVGSPEWFGPGSRIIITTRDQQLLTCHQVKRLYELKELNKKDALLLLKWKAFRKEKADPTCVHVLNRVVTYASGLPLALEVIGSHLFGMSVERWESAIDFYIRNFDKGIQSILEVSFTALQNNLKSVFLDIACCLKGCTLTDIECILSALYENDMKYPIELLVQKSLIKHEYGRVKMHDLIQDMGKQIDLKKSHKQPGKRKRLWLWKEIIEVLKHNKGTSKIEIIYLDVPISHREQIIEWDGNGFKKMKNLKILIIKNGKFSEAPKCLPNSLRVLEWWGYPSNCLPSDFQPNKLVMCNLPDGCFTSFELNLSSKIFQNLTVLKFDGCKSLTHIPNMSLLSNLEILSFEWCFNLVMVHESIGRLSKVKEISAGGCRNLVSFPPIHLTSLEKLGLSDCDRLESFPEISGKLENMRTLELFGTAIKELPMSVVNMVSLQILRMRSYGGFKLPCSILMMPKLVHFEAECMSGIKWVKEEGNKKTIGSIVSSKLNRLEVQWCRLRDDFFSLDFTRFVHLEYLNLSGNIFTFLPECIKDFQSLEYIDVSDCYNLQEIRGVPPNIKYFYARNCKSLSSSSISMLINEELYEAGMKECHLWGVRIPRWFDKKSRGPSTSFWFRNKLPNNILFLLASAVHWAYPTVFINGKQVQEYRELRETVSSGKEGTYIFELDLELNLCEVALRKEWNHLEVTYAGLKWTSSIRAMGIHIFNWESSMEDIRFSHPYKERKLDNGLNSFESDNN